MADKLKIFIAGGSGEDAITLIELNTMISHWLFQSRDDYIIHAIRYSKHGNGSWSGEVEFVYKMDEVIANA